jgi:hypothetical protein
LYAVKRLGATVSTTFLNLIPVVTAISGSLLLQEKLLGIEIVGMGLIMGSIYVLNKVTTSLKTASYAEKRLQPSSAIVGKRKRTSDFAIRANSLHFATLNATFHQD